MGKILSADVLDIIFDQRNKEYGAYDLRKHYQRRLTKSLLVTSSVVVFICTTYVLLGSMKPGKAEDIMAGEVTLAKVEPKEKPVEKITPPPVKQVAPPQEIKTIKNLVPQIVPDKMVDKTEMPEQTDMDNAKIGDVNKNGRDDVGEMTPPVEANKGVVTAPESHDEGEKIFERVEIESKYPGGVSAWAAFLYRKLVYPQQAIDEGKQGTVVVRFIVDKEGNVSDVEAISGPEELRASAVSVIKKSGQWEPAIQNGKKVKSYKSQPITFKLSEDQ